MFPYHRGGEGIFRGGWVYLLTNDSCYLRNLKFYPFHTKILLEKGVFTFRKTEQRSEMGYGQLHKKEQLSGVSYIRPLLTLCVLSFLGFLYIYNVISSSIYTSFIGFGLAQNPGSWFSIFSASVLKFLKIISY